MASGEARFLVGGTGLRLSYTPVEVITGLRLVERRPLGSNPGQRACGVAAAASLKVCGVALWDIPTARAHIAGPQVGQEHCLAVVSFCVIKIRFATAAAEGDPLMAAANGEVQVPGAPGGTYAAADVTNTRAIVGHAEQAVSAGADGFARITV